MPGMLIWFDKETKTRDPMDLASGWKDKVIIFLKQLLGQETPPVDELNITVHPEIAKATGRPEDERYGRACFSGKVDASSGTGAKSPSLANLKLLLNNNIFPTQEEPLYVEAEQIDGSWKAGVRIHFKGGKEGNFEPYWKLFACSCEEVPIVMETPKVSRRVAWWGEVFQFIMTAFICFGWIGDACFVLWIFATMGGVLFSSPTPLFRRLTNPA